MSERDAPAPEVRERWFTKSHEYDAWLLRELGTDLDAAASGACDRWAKTPRGRIALIILLDQITRNVRRDTGAMFANDPKALALAHEGVARGEDRELRAAERSFLYMPFMHSEQLSDQDLSVELFTRLAADAPAVPWALRHREVIARFGRFPHRNALLGRVSTPDEVAFLQEPGSAF